MDKSEKNSSSVNFYFYFILFGMYIGEPISFLRTFFNINLIQPLLLIYFVVKIYFIVMNAKYIKFSYSVLILFILSFFALFIGLVEYDFSRRIITDFLKPILFLLIVVIFSNFEPKMYAGILEKFKNNSKALFIYSIISSIVFFYFLRLTGRNNVGAVPPVEIPLCLALSSLNVMYIIMNGAIIFLSGKRAILISMISLIGMRLVKSNLNTLMLLIFLTPIIFSGLYFSSSIFSSSVAFSKYNYTINGFKDFISGENTDFTSLDKYTGSRISEASSALKDVDAIDLFFGKGLGYTYDYEINQKVLDENRGNIHFTPLSLLVYYGIIFTVVFYFYLLKLIFFSFQYQASSELLSLLFFLISYIFLASFFSYAIFNGPLWPMVLGLIIAEKKNIMIGTIKGKIKPV